MKPVVKTLNIGFFKITDSFFSDIFLCIHLIHVSVSFKSIILQATFHLLPKLIKIVYRYILSFDFYSIEFILLYFLFLFAKLRQRLRIEVMALAFSILPAVIICPVITLALTRFQDHTGFVLSFFLGHVRHLLSVSHRKAPVL